MVGASGPHLKAPADPATYLQVLFEALKPPHRLITPSPNEPLFADPATCLPPEIASHILQYALRPENEQRATLLTERRQMLLSLSGFNRSWNALSRRHLYTNIAISKSNKGELFAQRLKNDPRLATLIQSLELGDRGSRGSSGAEDAMAVEKHMRVGASIREVAIGRLSRRRSETSSVSLCLSPCGRKALTLISRRSDTYSSNHPRALPHHILFDFSCPSSSQESLGRSGRLYLCSPSRDRQQLSQCRAALLRTSRQPSL